MIGRQKFRNGADGDYLPVSQHGHPVTNLVQSVEVMGDEEHRQAQSFLQAPCQMVERRRADGIEASA